MDLTPVDGWVQVADGCGFVGAVVTGLRQGIKALKRSGGAGSRVDSAAPTAASRKNMTCGLVWGSRLDLVF